ncbi:glutamine-hydrolyzing carbamoyl-phosphate synthase small subunit [Candidatus Liberibacter americanus]|uniref:Carbamoyl phosphate synthase small chain n=1 Tax=Candidatus Liberibacter americanus str. Sao Paulo TaxID=1261131 RepID=U6B6D3_9HYPH|nr:glutamine-hydrolyzing carbamoyl-phosphate synthase small subunit [Candidatus Liberibacter americanus]AHA27431.1 Carbamoylphosphate synthase small subunit [Candidatus Liberibacter americanus str. Sao Paulo]EMS36704.1 carbamoyl phosphate synthase small subunit [Candidatus Liberibacter americanus PW_SP]
MAMTARWNIKNNTAVLVLADGSVIEGMGCGATGSIQAEICFNTSLTGYQEILTDPSYLGQIVNFTFPHIGNVGVNNEDFEYLSTKKFKGAFGLVLKSEITDPSNYRSNMHFDDWLKSCGIIGLSGVDTRALTIWIRDNGVSNAVIAHNPNGQFDIEDLKSRVQNYNYLKDSELVMRATAPKNISWLEKTWQWGREASFLNENDAIYHVVCVDYGVKSNILRHLVDLGCKITIVPADTSAKEILSFSPDGIVLSNGPGDPVITADYASPIICDLIDFGLPIFGICLGHQLLGLSLGARSVKMHQGHHGANHPVKNLLTGKVEIVSMNHGFAIDSKTLPANIEETHISLFDKSNCGLRIIDKPVFSVQYHPESSPGPQDSHYLFSYFVDFMRIRKGL